MPMFTESSPINRLFTNRDRSSTKEFSHSLKWGNLVKIAQNFMLLISTSLLLAYGLSSSLLVFDNQSSSLAYVFLLSGGVQQVTSTCAHAENVPLLWVESSHFIHFPVKMGNKVSIPILEIWKLRFGKAQELYLVPKIPNLPSFKWRSRLARKLETGAEVIYPSVACKDRKPLPYSIAHWK